MDELIGQAGGAMPEGLPGDWEQGAVPVIKIWAEQTVQAEQYTPIKTGASVHIPLTPGTDAAALAQAAEALQAMLVEISQRVGVAAVEAYWEKKLQSTAGEPQGEPAAPQPSSPLPAGPKPKQAPQRRRREGTSPPSTAEFIGDPERYGGGYLGRLRWQPKAKDLLYNDMFDMLVSTAEVSSEGVEFKIATSNYDTVKLASRAPLYDTIIGKIWPEGLGGAMGDVAVPEGTVIRCKATEPYKDGNGSIRGVTSAGNPYVNIVDASRVDAADFQQTAVSPEKAFGEA